MRHFFYIEARRTCRQVAEAVERVMSDYARRSTRKTIPRRKFTSERRRTLKVLLLHEKTRIHNDRRNSEHFFSD